MSAVECPDLEVLFDDMAPAHADAVSHAKGCVACAAMLEDHRQLEKDLFRIADPFPPAQFVGQVMAKVKQAPAPLATEVRTGIAIVFGTVGLAIATLLGRGGGFAQLGTGLASSVLHGRQIALAIDSGLGAAWRTAALPLTVTLSVVLAVSLIGLKRLSGMTSESKVLS